ncbi:MAG: DUF4199 domain-containing protein [Aureibaculum sp.]|nr:DUF4199 domain-containing protein [Aureibaculum sp.]
MENQQKHSKRKIMINYGLLLAFLSILISVANYAIGDTYNPHWAINVVSVIIMIVILVLGIKKLKEINEGYLSLGEALKTGIGIALLAALIFVIYFYVFAKFIEPEFINRTNEVNLAKALERSPNMTEEAMEMQENMTKKYFFVFSFGFIFIFNLFIGFVVSLITGLVMKKTDEEITSI